VAAGVPVAVVATGVVLRLRTVREVLAAEAEAAAKEVAEEGLVAVVVVESTPGWDQEGSAAATPNPRTPGEREVRASAGRFSIIAELWL
jgi:hypothetical protein